MPFAGGPDKCSRTPLLLCIGLIYILPLYDFSGRGFHILLSVIDRKALFWVCSRFDFVSVRLAANILQQTDLIAGTVASECEIGFFTSVVGCFHELVNYEILEQTAT